MKVRRNITLAIFLSMFFLFVFAATAMAATYEIPVNTKTVTMPVRGMEPGARSTNCWEFAQKIYKAIWGVNFSGERGTQDDLLRNVPTGSARAITTANTRRFISEARLGATIRITTVVNGDDTNGRYKHSMILIDKDDNGFTVYEGSINGRVRIKSYTWSDFANGYFGAHYGYYKYIKWPGANPLGEPQDDGMAELQAAATCSPKLRKSAIIPGDVNRDGMVTSEDARLALRRVVELENLPSKGAFRACDVDGDGLITAVDARMILRAAVELEELG